MTTNQTKAILKIILYSFSFFKVQTNCSMEMGPTGIQNEKINNFNNKIYICSFYWCAINIEISVSSVTKNVGFKHFVFIQRKRQFMFVKVFRWFYAKTCVEMDANIVRNTLICFFLPSIRYPSDLSLYRCYRLNKHPIKGRTKNELYIFRLNRFR